MSDDAKPVPNEGTGSLPPSGKELVVLGKDGLTLKTEGTVLVVLPRDQGIRTVRNTLANQADTNDIPL